MTTGNFLPTLVFENSPSSVNAGVHVSVLVSKDRIWGVMWIEEGEQCMSLPVTDLPWRQLHRCISLMLRAAVVTPGVYY